MSAKFKISSHGGARKGAGRPRGAKKRVTEEAIKRAGQGETPLEYMLRVMRDPRTTDDRRDRMAMGAAPYVHAKMVEHSGHVTQETWIVNAGEAVSEMDAEAWRDQVTQH